MRLSKFRYTPLRSNSASRFKRFFSEWHYMLEWFEKNDTSDLPYWYLERTNIGHLALASYQINGRPLQEFSMLKGRGAEKGPGRADLYIDFPPGAAGSRPCYLSIEAKQRWCPIKSEPKNLEKAVQASLLSAITDCRELNDKGWEDCQRIGISFILPYFKFTGSNFNDMTENILMDFNSKLEKVAKSSRGDFIAIHYAPLKVSKRRKFLSEYGWCPGIAIIGRFL